MAYENKHEMQLWLLVLILRINDLCVNTQIIMLYVSLETCSTSYLTSTSIFFFANSWPCTMQEQYATLKKVQYAAV